MAETFDDSEMSRSTKGRGGFPVEPQRLLGTLWERRRVFLFTLIFFVFGAFVYVKLMMGNAWATEVLLQYEGDIAVGDIGRQSRYTLGPAAEALEQRPLLEKVREVSKFQGSIRLLRRSIGYEVDFASSTLRIGVSAGSQMGAVQLAHHVTDVFLGHHTERQARRIEQELRRLQTRLDGAKAEAKEAREAYRAFLNVHGIPQDELEDSSAGASVVELLTQSELIASEVRALEARAATLRALLSTTPKTTALSGTDPARQAYDALRRELAVARASLSPDHPRVRSLQEQVDKLSRQVGRGGGSVDIVENDAYLSLSTELRETEWQLASLRERQKGFEAIAANTKKRADAISGVEGEAAALLAAVKVNEDLVARLQATDAALEDALEHPPSGFVVLDPGAIPEYPVENKQKKVVFLTISMLGGLLALFLALRKEFRGFLLRAPSEVAFWGHGPVLASMAAAPDRYCIDDLIASLDDYAPDARGKFLLLGARPNESRLAQELGRRLRSDWFHDVPNEGSPDAGPSAEGVSGPPPSGPYPIGGAQPRTSKAPSAATALALRPVQLVRREPSLLIEVWDGPPEGQPLRRAARLADRVILLIASGTVTPKDMLGVKRRLGRDTGIGFVVLGVPEDYEKLPDRIGDVTAFWAV